MSIWHLILKTKRTIIATTAYKISGFFGGVGFGFGFGWSCGFQLGFDFGLHSGVRIAQHKRFVNGVLGRMMKGVGCPDKKWCNRGGVGIGMSG